MQPIHLTYTPDRADFVALYAGEPTPAVLRVAFIGSVVAMSAGLGWLDENSAFFAALTAWSPPWGEVLTVAVMVVVMFGVLAVLRRLSREVRAVRAAAAARPIAFAADSDGITVSEAGRTDVCPWNSVLSARLGDGRVFLALAAGRVLALPRRAFADDAAMFAFADAAETRVLIESDREDGIVADAEPETAR